jgi:hypothetical protein
MPRGARQLPAELVPAFWNPLIENEKGRCKPAFSDVIRVTFAGVVRCAQFA